MKYATYPLVKNKHRVKREFFGIAFVVGLALLAAFGRNPAAAQQATRKSNFEIVGPFRVAWDDLSGVIKDGKTVMNFKGGPNGRVQATTTRYDLAAPRITMTLNRANVPETAEATGGVTGEARDTDRQQNISFRSDRATYRAASGANPARIDLTGNVRCVFRGPEVSPGDPPVMTAQSGSLVFNPDGGVTFQLTKGSGAGTLVEPKPKEKP